MKSIIEHKKVEHLFKKFYIFKQSTLISINQYEDIAKILEASSFDESEREKLIGILAKQKALTDILINETKRASYKTIRAIEDNSYRSHNEVINAIKKQETDLIEYWNEFIKKYHLSTNGLEK